MRRIATRTNKMMAVIEVEDLTGTIEAVAFPERYEALGGLLVADAIIEITAKIDTRGDRRQLIIEDASRDLPLARVAETPPVAPIEIRLPVSGDIWRDIAVMQALHALLERHEGDRPVELLVPSGSNIRRFRSRNRRVEWSQTLMRELEDALGPNCVRLEHEAVPQAAD
jgi:DNA polymerase-3 subunit alpha